MANPKLEAFVNRAEDPEPIASYEELQEVVSPEVVSALTDVILTYGKPSKYRKSGNLAILESKSRGRMVRGVVQSNTREDDTPAGVYIAEYKRQLMRFRRNRWVIMAIDEPVGYGAAVNDGDEFYMPRQSSEESISFWRDKIGGAKIQEVGGITTGYGIANESALEAPRAFNLFLQVTGRLVKELVMINPTIVES